MASKLMRLAFENLFKSASVANYDRVLSKCQFVDGGPGFCVASLHVAEEHCNRMGTLHGGLTATLVDSVSSLALVTDQESSLTKLGVSVDMHLTYTKAAKLGEEVLIDARVLRRGRSLAFLTVELRNRSTNDLIAKGSHTKFLS